VSAAFQFQSQGYQGVGITVGADIGKDDAQKSGPKSCWGQ
jgi:hypothetical protein